MQQTTKSSVWLQLYFVLATMLGLILIVVGASTLLTTTLTQNYFKPQPPVRSSAPMPYMDNEVIRMVDEGDIRPTEAQAQALESWRIEYERWQKDEQTYDWEAEERKRTMAWSLAVLIVGLPVFVIHAPFIFIKMKNNA